MVLARFHFSGNGVNHESYSVRSSSVRTKPICLRGGVDSEIVTQTTRKPLHWWKAVLWSTVLTTFIVFAIQASNRCFLLVNGAGWMLAISGLMWFWILLFFLFSNRGRLALLGCTLLVLLAYANVNVDRFPIGAAEARAVMHLRRMSQAADSYRREHPVEGFPASLPTISKGDDTESTERLYKIAYAASMSNSGGPVDRLVIQVNPLWRDCGYARSFVTTEEGKIHSTVEPRPARISDPTL